MMLSFKDSQAVINQELESLQINREPADLYDPVRYILSTGGKRLRPALVLMGCNLFTDDYRDAIEPAIGIELFHNFTLLHDDIMDNASMRRNHPTVHEKWNQKVAILSGDAMCILSYDLISHCPENVLQPVLQLFNKTALEVCEGQQYDMNFEAEEQVTVEEYIQMIELKTSALIAAGLQIGAIIGGAPEEDAKHMYEFGRNLGIAFQLRDDYLDVYGNQNIFGKKIGVDIIANKKTFLLIKALELSKGDIRNELKNWLIANEFDPEEKIKKIRSIFDTLEIKKITGEMADKTLNLALKALNKVQIDCERKTELFSFAKGILNRTK